VPNETKVSAESSKVLVVGGRNDMPLILIACVVVLCLLLVFWIKRTRDQRELMRASITPEELHTLFQSSKDVPVFDVRLPLDFLADAEIIPGAARIPPKELLENPSLIPKDKDAVVYCTCATDETGRRIVKQARGMNFLRLKFLKGGLSAWKELGYSVVPYEKSFHLDTRT
jgi:rhodanese-related sulfurtransferase